MFWLKRYAQKKILDEILPPEAKEAIEQGGLYIHALDEYFSSELALLDLSNLAGSDGAELMVALLHSLKQARNFSSQIILPYFDYDLGYKMFKYWPGERLSGVLAKLFEYMALEPRCNVTLNIGDDVSAEGRFLTQAVFSVLNSGHTKLEPQVVFRVKQGANLSLNDPNYDLLIMALSIARDRQGMAFSFMDSPLNAQWVRHIAYTSQGVRVEPEQIDLYRGCRGQVVPARVSLNVPLLLAFGEDRLMQTLAMAARVLAHRVEVGNRQNVSSNSPLIINLAGLVPEDDFERLSRLSGRVSQLRSEYQENFMLASTGENVEFAYSTPSSSFLSASPTLSANLQQLLPGGHCYTVASGPHRTLAELYEDLLLCAEAGVSFMRFSVEDVRCASCSLAVAAAAPCPACGQEQRRVVVSEETRLEEWMRNC